MTHANSLVKKNKKNIPDVKIILGGVHPSALPEETLENQDIDYVFRGEGKETFYELVKAIDENNTLDNIAGISYKIDGRLYHSQNRNRGCVFNCMFCVSSCVWNNVWRGRTAENIIAEPEVLIANYGISNFLFADALFTFSRKQILSFCNMLLKNDISISWGCLVHINTVDDYLLRIMKRAGC